MMTDDEIIDRSLEKEFEIETGSDEDDDFGDFEEGNDSVEVTEDVSTFEPELLEYRGDFNNSAKQIDSLLELIFTGEEEAKKSTDVDFKFDERSQNIFQRLVDDDVEFHNVIWKNTMVYKQLLLNLDIPLNSETTTIEKKTTGLKNIYDIESISDNSEIPKLLHQVPKFDTLQINKDDAYYRDISANTEKVLNDAKTCSSTLNINDLFQMKQELLKLLSLWDEKMKDVQAENAIFTSYVENIIDNTQKSRRVNKKINKNPMRKRK